MTMPLRQEILTIIATHLAALPGPNPLDLTRQQNLADALVKKANEHAYRALAFYDQKTMQQFPSEKNEEPVEQWLAVWEGLQGARRHPDERVALAKLCLAVHSLYKLLEPPSVREARLKDGAS